MPNARRSHKVDTEPTDFQGKYAGNVSLTKELLKERLPSISAWDIMEQKEQEFVSIRLLKSLVVKTKGEATGTIYIFNGAGSIVNVDKSDVESIMKRNKSVKSCCGSYSSPYFEIV
jgi:hypothetical protein